MKLRLELERRADMEESVDLELDNAINKILGSKLNITHSGKRKLKPKQAKPITESLLMRSLREPE